MLLKSTDNNIEVSIVLIVVWFVLNTLFITNTAASVSVLGRESEPRVVHVALTTASKPASINLTCEDRDDDYSTPGSFKWTREPLPQERDDRLMIDERTGSMFGQVNKYKLWPTASVARTLQINNITMFDDGLYCCFKASSLLQRRFMLKVHHDIESIKFLPVTADGRLTATAGAEFRVGCAVEKSWPAAMISMRVADSPSVLLEPMKATYKTSPTPDGLHRTEIPTHEDDQKFLVCEATLLEVGIKRRQSARINVRYAPLCARLDGPFRLGLNRIGNVTCAIEKANPRKNLRFEWLLNERNDAGTSNEQWNVPFMFTNETSSTILVKPTSLSQLVNTNLLCSISNGVGGETRCLLPIALGARPDPVSNCQHSYPTNTSIQISCQLGFHQGDQDQQCVLFKLDKKLQMMKEYARARMCAFVIEHTNLHEYHKLHIFSINKFGDSLQQAVTIELNANTGDSGARKQSSSYFFNFLSNRHRSTEKVVIVFVLVAFLFIIACMTSMCCCCCCHDGGWLNNAFSKLMDGNIFTDNTQKRKMITTKKEMQNRNKMEMFWNTYGKKDDPQISLLANTYSEKFCNVRTENEEMRLLKPIDEAPVRFNMQNNNGQCDMILDCDAYHIVEHNRPNSRVSSRQMVFCRHDLLPPNLQRSPTTESTVSADGAAGYGGSQRSCHYSENGKQSLTCIHVNNVNDRSGSMRSRKVPTNPPPIEPRRSTSRSTRYNEECGFYHPIKHNSPRRQLQPDSEQSSLSIYQRRQTIEPSAKSQTALKTNENVSLIYDARGAKVTEC